MSEQDPAQGTSESVKQELNIHNIYLKDVSFESPNSPHVFATSEPPKIELNLSINSQMIQEETYEVVLGVTVTAKTGEKTAFLVELKQAGVFSLRGFDQENIGPMLGIYCPNVLFPYAREAVANLISKGGFPQLLLEPVNFEALYAHHVKQQTKDSQATIQ